MRNRSADIGCDAEAPLPDEIRRDGTAWRALASLNPYRDAVHHQWAIEDRPENRLGVCEADLAAATAQIAEHRISGDVEAIDRWEAIIASLSDKRIRLVARAERRLPGPEVREGRVWQGRRQDNAVQSAIQSRLRNR